MEPDPLTLAEIRDRQANLELRAERARHRQRIAIPTSAHALSLGRTARENQRRADDYAALLTLIDQVTGKTDVPLVIGGLDCSPARVRELLDTVSGRQAETERRQAIRDRMDAVLAWERTETAAERLVRAYVRHNGDTDPDKNRACLLPIVDQVWPDTARSRSLCNREPYPQRWTGLALPGSSRYAPEVHAMRLCASCATAVHTKIQEGQEDD